MPRLTTVEVNYPEPHRGRTREILKAHPEVKKLFGYTPSTALFAFGVVALQIAACWMLRDSPWWVVLLAAYTVGAFANHALWVLIHECTHNLVFKQPTANSLLQIFCNFPIVFPAAMSFRTYHLQHHIHQGELDRDADLARPWEANLVGNRFGGKALWMLFFFVAQMVRTAELKEIQLLNRWTVLNLVTEVAFLAAVGLAWGPMPLLYLFLASVFSIGLHPLGARWIQEHFIVHEKQETYSYYGPLNRVAFNVGYHNEHHDFMRVPWTRLPALKAMAPEFYETLYWHPSWTRLWLKFLLDPTMSLASRVTRPTQGRAEGAGLAPSLELTVPQT